MPARTGPSVLSLKSPRERSGKIHRRRSAGFPEPAPPAVARQARATSSKALGSLIISVMSGYIAIRAAPSARR
ncbi:hypothetical protein GCM10010140_05260 [Streptosporangium pseudovulgare]|uniref:Uncharacterized protein n=1 Tax=Streptosporangium pseudovulgare TaxID=35765 RepID=A0ABQ2QFG0_9ACTN|nr:hypothetical protein GCM10010140_05260 [Streptosporangium pseudovulgare]